MAAANKAYEVITKRIIELLEQGTVPWRKPWIDGPASRSYAGRSYRGINQLLLSAEAGFRGLRGCWITYNQAKKAGGSVKKGAKGIPVVLWKWMEKKNEDDDKDGGKSFPFCRYYTVFSICQTEGIEEPAWVSKLIERDVHVDPIEAAEAIWVGYENRPLLTTGGDRAAYVPDTDQIMMPDRDRFDSSEAFYNTFFHEVIHSTGHPRRLGRSSADRWAKFGSESYSREELVAEMGAAFLASDAGIDTEGLTENTAAYIKSWIRALKDDPRMVVIAAAQAQKAADLILGNSMNVAVP